MKRKKGEILRHIERRFKDRNYLYRNEIEKDKSGEKKKQHERNFEKKGIVN